MPAKINYFYEKPAKLNYLGRLFKIFLIQKALKYRLKSLIEKFISKLRLEVGLGQFGQVNCFGLVRFGSVVFSRTFLEI